MPDSETLSVAIHRSVDPDEVNRVCNDPAVLPMLGLGMVQIDVTDAMENRRNVFLMGEHGGAMFHWSAPGVYGAHNFILPSGRGRWARAACTEMLDTMFAAHDARMIWAQTPIANRGCRMMNRILGFTSEGVGEAVLVADKGAEMVETFVMERR